MEEILLKLKHNKLRYILCNKINLQPYNQPIITQANTDTNSASIVLDFDGTYLKVEAKCRLLGSDYFFPLSLNLLSRDKEFSHNNRIDVPPSELKAIEFLKPENKNLNAQNNENASMVFLELRSGNCICIIGYESDTQSIPSLGIHFFENKKKFSEREYFKYYKKISEYILSELHTSI